MVYFVLAFKVQLALWTILVASTNSANVKGHLTDMGLISSFIDQFIKPYLQSIRTNLKPRSREETDIEKAIRLKVEELRPLLQDNDEYTKKTNDNEDNLTLEGTDETTIIEFVSRVTDETRKQKGKAQDAKQKPDTFKANINRYKQLRRAIAAKLEKENTEPKTKRLIIRTLDEMLALLVERQCSWYGAKSVNLPDHVFRAQKNTRNSIDKIHNLTNEEWTNLRKEYIQFLEYKEGQEDSFLRQFHNFFAKSYRASESMSERYKIRCQLVKVNDNHNMNTKNINREGDKDNCKPFNLCTDELKEFLTNFYTYLNDSSVSIFQNYAAMYIRDVNIDDTQEKNTLVEVLDKLSKAAERKVRHLFLKKLGELTLDKNKQKTRNIELLNQFINSLVAHTRKVLNKILDNELEDKKVKMFSTVKDDLKVNIKVDMENLVGMFTDRICKFFILCNGRYDARRSSFGSNENQQIYVKVQVSLDDELKDAIGRNGKVLEYFNMDNLRNIARQGANIAKNLVGKNRFARNNQMDLSRYNKVNITRTTFFTTMATTVFEIKHTTKANTKADTEADTKAKTKVDTKADTKLDSNVDTRASIEATPENVKVDLEVNNTI